MRVYISSHDLDSAESLALALVEAGHEIASTWHAEGGPKLPLTEADQWEARAARNFDQIDSAGVLVLIAATDRVPGGKFVEAGYAMARGLAVYTLGAVENGMMHAANQCGDVADLLAALS